MSGEAPPKATEKVEVFIDGQTFFYLQKDKLQWWIDPALLLEWVEEEIGPIDQATYFARVNLDGLNKEEGYLRALVHMGFQVRPIPSKEYFSPKPDLGSMTPHVIVDLIGRANIFDHAVIIGNDVSYVPALRWLHANNKRYTVLGTPSWIAPDLLAVCGQSFVDLNDDDVRDRILKEQRV